MELMVEKLKAETVALHGQLITKKWALGPLVLGQYMSTADMKRAINEKEDVTRLFTLEKAMRKISAAQEQLKKDVLTVIMKAGE